jgi:uncharacterized protein YegP (UPF0339 family)
MRKAIGLIVLAVGLGVVANPGLLPVDAQEKTKAKTKDEPKAKDKRAHATGTIEIYEAKDGYRYRVKDAEGKTIAMPPRGHENKQDVLKTLDEIKEILNKVKPTEVKD